MCPRGHIEAPETAAVEGNRIANELCGFAPFDPHMTDCQTYFPHVRKGESHPCS